MQMATVKQLQILENSDEQLNIRLETSYNADEAQYATFAEAKTSSLGMQKI